MKIIHIKQDTLQKAKWSGGESFEYYIYPELSKYQDHDFVFRVSSATIEIAQSVFTQFDNYTRYLTMLDVPLSIDIDKIHYELAPYEIVKFHSDNYCVSHSKGKDFNLMVQDKVMYHKLLLSEDTRTLICKHIILFALQDSTVEVNDEKHHLLKHDCLIINNLENKQLQIASDQAILIGKVDY